MSKKLNNSSSSAENEVFEIIELAIDDLELLTRAFNMIRDVCDDVSHPELKLDDSSNKQFVH